MVFWSSSAGHALIYLFADMTSTQDNERWIRIDKRGRVAFCQYSAMTYSNDVGRLTWTWRIKPKVFAGHLKPIDDSLKGSQLLGIRSMMDETRRWPGFRGCRSQYTAMWDAIKEGWKRHAIKEPLPDSVRLYYVERLRARWVRARQHSDWTAVTT